VQTITTPRQKNIVPIVAIREGMRIFTINIPLKSPANKPTIKEIPRARKIFWVKKNKVVNTQPENPIMEGKERSISPEITIRVRAKAIIAEKGIVDIKEW
jgi:hypothetical protein